MANYISIIPDGETVDALLKTVQNSNLSATHKITRSATLVVAASDSSAKSKAQADYVCTGTNDHITINAAIATLPTTGNVTIPGSGEVLEANQGGKVLLLEGSFQTAGAIDVSGRSNVTIEGVGPATVIYNTATDGSHAIQSINTGAPKNRVVVKNLTVVGNAASGDGIHLREIHYQKVEDVYCLSNGGHGINICGDTEDGAAENKIISNVQCLFNKLDGLHLEGLAAPPYVATHETLISNSHFEENYRYNIGLFNTIDIHISNCSVEDGHGSYELYSENGNQLKISNCVFEGNVSISGGYALISNSYFDNLLKFPSSTHLKLSGCRAVIPASVFSILDVSNSDILLTGETTISGTCSINGGELGSDANGALILSANSARLTIVGSNITSFGGRIGVSSGITTTRALINCNNMRTCNPNISGIAYLQMNSNLILGGGTCTLSNISGVIQISNNLLSNYFITLDNTCSPTAKQLLNNLEGTITDNSV